MPYPAKISREEILEAALTLLESDGPTTLSMRNLATKLGVNASSLYHHFSGKEVLEAALAEEGARLFLERLEAATQEQSSAQTIETTAITYLAFSYERPALYDLIMAPRPPAKAEAGASKDLWNFVLAQVGGVTGRGDNTAAAVAFWSFLHGFISLERSGLFGLSGARGGLEVGLGALLAGLSQIKR